MTLSSSSMFAIVKYFLSLFSLQPVIYYLVKWCSLPYEDATWELKEDVDEGKVEEFKKIQNRQPRLKRTVSCQVEDGHEWFLPSSLLFMHFFPSLSFSHGRLPVHGRSWRRPENTRMATYFESTNLKESTGCSSTGTTGIYLTHTTLHVDLQRSAF